MWWDIRYFQNTLKSTCGGTIRVDFHVNVGTLKVTTCGGTIRVTPIHPTCGGILDVSFQNHSNQHVVGLLELLAKVHQINMWWDY